LSRKSDITTHQLIHSCQRPYACGVCNKTFSRKSGMKTHQPIHKGQHPYACEVC
jgi:KRAB domain-containing zinc finger protein